MAEKVLGARKDGMQVVVSIVPSINYTPPAKIPVPYPVNYPLKPSENVSSNVFYNDDPAFALGSHTVHVTGDEAGSLGGIISGTTSEKAIAIDHSRTVFVNSKNAVRCDDMFCMNDKNTVGALTCALAPVAPDIVDNKIKCETTTNEDGSTTTKARIDTPTYHLEISETQKDGQLISQRMNESIIGSFHDCELDDTCSAISQLNHDFYASCNATPPQTQSKIEEEKKETEGFWDGFEETTGVDFEKMQDPEEWKKYSQKKKDEIAAAIKERMETLSVICNEERLKAQRLMELIQNHDIEGAVKELKKTVKEEIEDLKAMGGALKDKVSQIPDDIDAWADKVGDDLSHASETFKDNPGKATGQMIGILGTAIVDIFNPFKKAKYAEEMADAAAKAKAGKIKWRNEQKKKKNDNVTVIGDCKHLDFNLKCDNTYPENVPKPENGCTVLPGERKESGSKKSKIEQAYADITVPNDHLYDLEDALGMQRGSLNNKYGEEITQLVTEYNEGKSKGEKIEYHHIKPLWAGGKHEGKNLIPLRNASHTGVGSPHGWYNQQLKDKCPEIKKKLKKCLQKSNKKHQRSIDITHMCGEVNIGKTARKLRKYKIYIRLCFKNCE